jgi:ferredoxin
MTHHIDETCDGCSACVRRCPVRAIEGVKKEPYTIIQELCIDCSVCGQTCPIASVTDAQGQVVDRIRRPLLPKPQFDPDLCNGCGLCADFCPFNCIQTTGPAFQGEAHLALPRKCVSCGECVRACIKGAVMLQAPPNAPAQG